MPPCYVISDVTVTDPERFQDYAVRAAPALEPFGGRFIVRGGAIEKLEGDWEPGRLVVIEFPDKESARNWYESDAYQEIIPIRQSAAIGKLIRVEGYSPESA